MTRRAVVCALVVGLGVASADAVAQTATSVNRGPARSSVPNVEKRAGTLMTKLPDVKLDKVPLVDAIDFLREATNANIHVNWKALEEQGIAKDAQVTMRARNVSLRTVLKMMLADVAPGGVLSFYQDEGVLEVTTKQLADTKLITRVYPVQDLLVDVPDFTQVESIQLQSSQRGTVQGAGGGGGNTGGQNSSGIFSGGQQNASQDTGGRGLNTRYGRADDLVAIIRETIQPEIWRENGGTAAIRFFNGHLIVTAPRSVHEALAGYVE